MTAPVTPAVGPTFWPSEQDYKEAMQYADLALVDANLRQCEVATDFRGLPQVQMGSFAVVFKLLDPTGPTAWAVRVFQNRVTDQQLRYAAISETLRDNIPPSMAGFVYVADGIRMKDPNGSEGVYPLVKMEWIDGVSLWSYADKHHQDQQRMIDLAARWSGLVRTLEGNEIAHGDLQHGNVLVLPAGELKLVDYDNMFVERLRGQGSPEFGHSNYQHPKRSNDDFSEKSDLFPAVGIYLSLLALSEDAGLWSFNNGNNLLFTQADFDAPAQSALFARLEGSANQRIARIATFIRQWCESGHPLQPFRFGDVAAVWTDPNVALPDISTDAAGGTIRPPRPRVRPVGSKRRWLAAAAWLVLVGGGAAAGFSLMPRGHGLPEPGQSVRVTRDDGQQYEGTVTSAADGVLHLRDSFGTDTMLRQDQVAKWEEAGAGKPAAASPWAEFRPGTNVTLQQRNGSMLLGTIEANDGSVLVVRELSGAVREIPYGDVTKLRRR